MKLFFLCALLTFGGSIALADETVNQAGTTAAKETLKFVQFCQQNPENAKCIAYEKHQREKKKADMKADIEMYKEASKDPEVRKYLEEQQKKEDAQKEKQRQEFNANTNKMVNDAMAGADRQRYLATINEMCKDPKSAGCEAAKEDYKEWKESQKKK